MGLQMSTNCIFVDEIFATSFRTRESCFFGVMFCLNMNFKETGLSKYDSTCRTFVISFRFRFRLIFDIFLFWTLKWKKICRIFSSVIVNQIYFYDGKCLILKFKVSKPWYLGERKDCEIRTFKIDAGMMKFVFCFGLDKILCPKI